MIEMVGEEGFETFMPFAHFNPLKVTLSTNSPGEHRGTASALPLFAVRIFMTVAFLTGYTCSQAEIRS